MAEQKLSFDLTDNAPVFEKNEGFLFNGQLVSDVHSKHCEVKHLNIYGEQLLLSIPLTIKSGLPGKRLFMPQFVPFYSLESISAGILSPPKELAQQQKVLSLVAEAIDSLKCAAIEINTLTSLWLPFSWAGFNVIPRVTFRLNTKIDQDSLFSNLRSNIQRHIKKSEKIHQLVDSSDAQLLFDLNKESYERKDQKHPFDFDILNRLCSYLLTSGKGRLIVAHNSQNQPIAAALFGLDKSHVYYITGGVLTDFKAEGSMSRLLYEGILWAKSQNLNFDFEGSMNQNIAQFFASFGAEPFTYYQFSKMNSKVYGLYKSLKS
jgi:lipid II:glycine glycyltransferase (peptidoglycan interpeptide bridge formation enzyme)